MSEPKAEATHVEQVAAGIWHWCVWDDRIGSESHGHAVSGEGGSVLIDPLRFERKRRQFTAVGTELPCG